MQRKSVQRTNHFISVRSWKSPENPAIIFCHPFTNSHAYWKPQLDDEHLSSHYVMISIDVLGHGRSSTLGEVWSFWDVAKAMLNIAKSIGEGSTDGSIEPPYTDDFSHSGCCLVGDSMGGFTALRAALLDHERKYVSMVCMVGSTGGTELERKIGAYYALSQDLAKTAEEGRPQMAIWNLAEQISNDQYGLTHGLEVSPELVEFGKNVIFQSYVTVCSNSADKGDGIDCDAGAFDYATLADALNGEAVGKQIRANFESILTRDSLYPLLRQRGKLKAPVYVIHGDADVAYPLAEDHHGKLERSIREGGGQCQVEVIEKAPHFLTVTHSTLFNQKLVNFIESHEGYR